MGSKGGGTSSSSGFNFGTSTQTPDPAAMAAYQSVLGQAQNVGQIPYQPYGGQMVAGFTPDQLAAFQGVRETQGISQPYIQGAQGLVGQALSYADPSRFTAEELSRYYNPYQQNVIDATMANMREMNASQQNDLTGNAIMKGAMGGDRVGIARAELARQQNLTNNATLAGLQQQGWQNALNQYNQQQQTAIGAAQSGAYGLGQLGSQAQQSALQGLQALLGTGGMQQALGQQQLQNAYEQWQQAMGYPYQQAQWQAGITGAIAPSMGGTTTSMGFGSNTQQQPQPSVGNQVAGLGLAGLSLLPKIYKDGGRVGKADGGYFDVLSLPTDDPGLPNVWGPQGLDQIARERWVSANADGELDGDAVMRADGGPLNMPLSAKREMYARSFVPAMELSAARPSFPTAPKIDVPQPHGGGGDGGLMGGLIKGLGSLSKEQAGGVKEGLGRLIGAGQPITLAGAMPGAAVGDVVMPEKDIGFGGIYADGGRVELADGGSPYAGWLDRSMPTGVAGSSLAPQIPSSSVFEPRQSLPSPIASSQGGGGMNPMMLMGMMGGGGSGGMSGMLPLLMMQQQQQAAQAAQADADLEAQRGDVLSQQRSPVGYAPTSLNYGQIDPMTGLYSVRGWSPYYMAPYADGGAVERRGYFRGAAVEDEPSDDVKLNGPVLKDYLVGLGAKPYEAALLAGNAGAESSYNPATIHDSGSGYGLWGHRLERLDAMRKFAGSDAPDWKTQAKFALQELRSRPEGRMISDTSTPEDIARAGMFFERPKGFSEKNPQGGLGYSDRLANIRGLLDGAPALAYTASDASAASNEGLGAIAKATAPAPSPAPAAAPAASSERTGLGSMWSPEVQQGLLAAGLGMMASRSPNFGTALGEGGLRGMQVYNSALENTRDAEKQKLAQSRLDANQALEAAKFAEEKRWHDLQARRHQAEEESKSIVTQNRQREAEADRLGLQGRDRTQYIVAGSLPRTNDAPLTATDKKAILEADDRVAQADVAIDLLSQAKRISQQAYGGVGAGTRSAVGVNLPDWLIPDQLASPEKSIATQDLQNLTTQQALESLKAIFGGNPTEGERAILLDIQGSVNKPDEIRQKIYDRGLELARRRLEINRERAAELRGGEFYKPKTKETPAAPKAEDPGVTAAKPSPEPAPPRYKDGDVAINKTTGEKLVFRAGKWEKAP
jgi:hypothetical protein